MTRFLSLLVLAFLASLSGSSSADAKVCFNDSHVNSCLGLYEGKPYYFNVRDLNWCAKVIKWNCANGKLGKSQASHCNRLRSAVGAARNKPHPDCPANVLMGGKDFETPRKCRKRAIKKKIRKAKTSCHAVEPGQRVVRKIKKTKPKRRHAGNSSKTLRQNFTSGLATEGIVTPTKSPRFWRQNLFGSPTGQHANLSRNSSRQSDYEDDLDGFDVVMGLLGVAAFAAQFFDDDDDHHHKKKRHRRHKKKHHRAGFPPGAPKWKKGRHRGKEPRLVVDPPKPPKWPKADREKELRLVTDPPEPSPKRPKSIRGKVVAPPAQ